MSGSAVIEARLDQTPISVGVPSDGANEIAEKTKLRILVIGSGGREHAIVSKLAAEDGVERVYVTPGNPGMFEEGAKVEKAELGSSKVADLIAFVKKKTIDLVVIGPEDPLCAGMADELRAAHIKVFGPNKVGARLEGDKIFSTAFNNKHNIPQPTGVSYTDLNAALAHLDGKGYPLVIKYPFLAAGKGVTITKNPKEAVKAVKACFEGDMAEKNGKGVLFQEFIGNTEGKEDTSKAKEMSAFFFVDTKSGQLRYLGSAQDHKTRFEDGHIGPNDMTGGMGTVSPSPFEKNDTIMGQVHAIGDKFLEGLKADGIDYQGVVFMGLMVDPDKKVKVLEYNVRFGDPEIQSLLARMKSSLAGVMMAVASGDGSLKDVEIELTGKAMTLILADPTYPNAKSVLNKVIEGIDKIRKKIKVIHAGTALNDEGKPKVAGGRVLGIVARGDDDTTFAQLNTEILGAAEKIRFGGVKPGYRTDIGLGKDDQY